jgi:hypothetical protein
VRKAADLRIVPAALATAVALFVLQASAATQILYRWTDAQGRVQYADKPPVGFKGEVTQVEVDATTQPASTPRAPRVAPEVMRDVVPDIAKARRDKRALLEAAVRRAQDKLAAAKLALEGGGEMQQDERQFIQRPYAQAQEGRSNCRQATDANGKAFFICPAVVPNEEYFGRQGRLEEAVKKAEEELSDAQAAYRRGVD